jgi:hypothetical protein
MGANLDADLDRLTAGLPVPPSELRLVETPITANLTVDTTGQVSVDVWSVAVFGAAPLGSPRVVFRTSHLTLVVDDDQWKLATFTSTQGPTPEATDALPGSWDDFTTVAAWRPAPEGVG